MSRAWSARGFCAMRDKSRRPSRLKWHGSTLQTDAYQTTGFVCTVATLTKPCGAASHGATSTQRQGAQVRVANWSCSGKPGYQRGEKVGSYSHSIFAASA